MFVHVDVAMVPHRSSRLGDEFIGKAVAGLDAGLRHVGHAVHLPGATLQDTVPVDRMGQGGEVVQRHFHKVALADMEQGGRNLAAEGESVKGLVADQRDPRVLDVHFELVGIAARRTRGWRARGGR